MSGDFVDSNIFVYLFDETDRFKRNVAERIVERGLQEHNASISYQVVQEVLNVLTSKLAEPISTEGARRFMLEVLAPLWRISPRPALYHRALDIQARYRYGFYDSLIVAAALEAGCDRLYSEDLQDGQRIEGLVIENPFRRS
ncbi:PIN domain-containing protein [Rubrobacter calidifluminis]|uniref:PIN domain-containing protein n=1 Tax=Rubrobacter calidifluminis TaxID=1392640 RepID=UPI0023625740|nr:PIN domain-containing protein [Rubrobacter calidifluminis]